MIVSLTSSSSGKNHHVRIMTAGLKNICSHNRQRAASATPSITSVPPAIVSLPTDSHERFHGRIDLYT